MTIYDIRDKVVKLHMYSVMHGHKACAFRSSIMINIKHIKCKRILIKICLNSEKNSVSLGTKQGLNPCPKHATATVLKCVATA